MNVDGILAAIPTMDAGQRKGVRRNAEALLANPDKQAAAQQVLDALDGEVKRAAASVAEQLRLVPTAKRVRDVFTYKPLTQLERKGVQVLLDHPGSTPEALSQELGWKKPIWRERFLAMLQKREAGLWPPDEAVVRDENFYGSLVAEITPDGLWTMKPEVVEAFAKLGVTPQNEEHAG